VSASARSHFHYTSFRFLISLVGVGDSILAMSFHRLQSYWKLVGHVPRAQTAHVVMQEAPSVNFLLFFFEG
jgi:hypothetical protein